MKKKVIEPLGNKGRFPQIFGTLPEGSRRVTDAYCPLRINTTLETSVLTLTSHWFIQHRTKFMVSRPRLHLPVQALVCVAAFGFGLPLAIALFPQKSQVRV